MIIRHVCYPRARVSYEASAVSDRTAFRVDVPLVSTYLWVMAAHALTAPATGRHRYVAPKRERAAYAVLYYLALSAVVVLSWLVTGVDPVTSFGTGIDVAADSIVTVWSGIKSAAVSLASLV